MATNIEQLERLLEHTFRDRTLPVQAVKHWPVAQRIAFAATVRARPENQSHVWPIATAIMMANVMIIIFALLIPAMAELVRTVRVDSFVLP